MTERPAIILTLPKPPSTNALWVSVPGKARVRSEVYRRWIRTAGWEVRRQFVGQEALACRFNVELHVPVSRRDSDNWIKPVLDLLQTCNVVTNDGNQHEVWVMPQERDDCAVALTPLPEMGGVRKATRPYTPRAQGKARASRQMLAFGRRMAALGPP